MFTVTIKLCGSVVEVINVVATDALVAINHVAAGMSSRLLYTYEAREVAQ